MIPVSVATTNRFFGDCRANSTMPSVERMCVRSFANAIAWLAQPHSGWTSSSASGASACQRSMSAGRMPACTWHSPSQIFSLRPVTRSSQRPRYMSGRKRISRSAGIASITARALPGRAAVVALGLHLGGRVHVRDDDGARDAPPSSSRSCAGVDRRGERAAGVQIGDQHGLLRAEDRRRLGHEVDAAEEDRRGVRRGRLPREPERVADVVGDVLHLGQLVVVGEDDRVALAGELAHLLVRAVACSTAVIRRSPRRARRRASGAECVSAPTEMKSTPVSA